MFKKPAILRLAPSASQLCHWCLIPTQRQLCPDCQRQLDAEHHRCRICALPLRPSATICGECLSQPPAFSQTLCAADHRYPFQHWLNAFKRQRDLLSAELLLDRLLHQVSTHYAGEPQPQWLIPVPLHWRKQWLRGINPAAWIAKRLSDQLGIPALPALRRVGMGPMQKSLKRQERLRNLRHDFQIHPPCLPHLQRQHVVLIDDVMTTAATARVLSAQLLQAGAHRVDVWCLTRTPRTQELGSADTNRADE